MIRKYIIEADDSIKGFDEEIARLEREWGAEEMKKGHWEDCSNGWCCSNCWRDVSHESDFCPHCGADMRKSE